MEDFSSLLSRLYQKSQETADNFIDLQEKDIRRKHLEILASEILVGDFSLKINMHISTQHAQEFKNIFHSEEQLMENYAHFFIQNINENIFGTSIFQTELVFRYFYSKLNGVTPGKEKKIFKIFANLFDDTENNWQKDECKLLVLIWTLRNTIHTGGIYLMKEEGCVLTYKGKEYKFEYGKAPNFLKDGLALELVFNLFDSIKMLFQSNKIKALGYFEHPSYLALK